MKRRLIATVSALMVMLCVACSVTRVDQIQDRMLVGNQPQFQRAFVAQLVHTDQVKALACEFAKEKGVDWRRFFPNHTTLINLVKWLNAQNLKYIADEQEYWSTPQETIERGGGDCEDLAILMASMLKALGYPHTVYVVFGDVQISKLTGLGKKRGHSWVEVDHPQLGKLIIENSPYLIIKLRDVDPYSTRFYWYRILIEFPGASQVCYQAARRAAA